MTCTINMHKIKMVSLKGEETPRPAYIYANYYEADIQGHNTDHLRETNVSLEPEDRVVFYFGTENYKEALNLIRLDLDHIHEYSDKLMVSLIQKATRTMKNKLNRAKDEIERLQSELPWKKDNKCDEENFLGSDFMVPEFDVDFSQSSISAQINTLATTPNIKEKPKPLLQLLKKLENTADLDNSIEFRQLWEILEGYHGWKFAMLGNTCVYGTPRSSFDNYKPNVNVFTKKRELVNNLLKTSGLGKNAEADLENKLETSSQASSESSLSEDDYNFKDVWPKLKRIGWYWKKGRNLCNFLYVKPAGVFNSNEEIFTNESDVLDFCRSNRIFMRSPLKIHDEEEEKKTSTEQCFPKTNSNLMKQSLMSEKEATSHSWQDSVESEEEFDGEKDLSEKNVEPSPSDKYKWKNMWSTLKRQYGWTSSQARGLDIGFYYIKPGYSVKNGKKGVDYFNGEEALTEYVKANRLLDDFSNDDQSDITDHEIKFKVDTSSKSKLMEVDLYSWGNVWSTLKKKNWHAKPARGLDEGYYYAPPSCTSFEPSEKNKTYFHTEKKLIEFAKKNGLLSQDRVVQDVDQMLQQNMEVGHNLVGDMGRRLIVDRNTSRSNVPTLSSDIVSPNKSLENTYKKPIDELEVTVSSQDSFEKNKMTEDDMYSWNNLWSILKTAQWHAKPARGLDEGYYYAPPNCTSFEPSEKNKTYFHTEKKLIEFAKKYRILSEGSLVEDIDQIHQQHINDMKNEKVTQNVFGDIDRRLRIVKRNSEITEKDKIENTLDNGIIDHLQSNSENEDNQSSKEDDEVGSSQGSFNSIEMREEDFYSWSSLWTSLLKKKWYAKPARGLDEGYYYAPPSCKSFKPSEKNITFFHTESKLIEFAKKYRILSKDGLVEDFDQILQKSMGIDANKPYQEDEKNMRNQKACEDRDTDLNPEDNCKEPRSSKKDMGQTIPDIVDKLSWTQLWKILIQLGWKAKAASGLEDGYLYTPPGGSKDGILGIDYFRSPEEIQAYVQKQNILKDYVCKTSHSTSHKRPRSLIKDEDSKVITKKILKLSFDEASRESQTPKHAYSSNTALKFSPEVDKDITSTKADFPKCALASVYTPSPSQKNSNKCNNTEVELENRVNELERAFDITSQEIIVSRDEQLNEIVNFFDSRFQSGIGGSLYVAGRPGTGKSASLSLICKRLPKMLAESNNGSKTKKLGIININAMSISSPSEVYDVLASEIYNGSIIDGSPFNFLKKYFQNQKLITVLIIDEMDALLKGHGYETYLSQLFEWAGQEYSSLILVGIANSVDMLNHHLSHLSSTIVEPKTVIYPPYRSEQILEILHQRLINDKKNSPTIFEENGLRLCAKKVASSSGDIRVALDICRKALDKHLSKIKFNDVCNDPLISLSDMMVVCRLFLESPRHKAIRSLSRLSKAILHVAFQKFNLKGGILYGNLYDETLKFLQKAGITKAMLTMDDFRNSIEGMGAHDILSTVGQSFTTNLRKRKIKFRLNDQDITRCLKEDALFSRYYVEAT